MTKRELRKLAESKGLDFMMSNGLFFFIFPGDLKAHAATKEAIEQVRLLPECVKPGPVIVPADTVSLEGLSPEQREAKVLELMGKPVPSLQEQTNAALDSASVEQMAVWANEQMRPNTIPGLDNYPIEAQS